MAGGPRLRCPGNCGCDLLGGPDRTAFHLDHCSEVKPAAEQCGCRGVADIPNECWPITPFGPLVP